MQYVLKGIYYSEYFDTQPFNSSDGKCSGSFYISFYNPVRDCQVDHSSWGERPEDERDVVGDLEATHMGSFSWLLLLLAKEKKKATVQKKTFPSFCTLTFEHVVWIEEWSPSAQIEECGNVLHGEVAWKSPETSILQKVHQIFIVFFHVNHGTNVNKMQKTSSKPFCFKSCYLRGSSLHYESGVSSNEGRINTICVPKSRFTHLLTQKQPTPAGTCCVIMHNQPGHHCPLLTHNVSSKFCHHV